MAAWRVENMPQGEKKKKRSAGKDAMIRSKIQEYAKRDRIKNG